MANENKLITSIEEAFLIKDPAKRRAAIQLALGLRGVDQGPQEGLQSFFDPTAILANMNNTNRTPVTGGPLQLLPGRSNAVGDILVPSLAIARNLMENKRRRDAERQRTGQGVPADRNKILDSLGGLLGLP